MSSGTAATYLPDSQVITLKENLDAFSDRDNPKGFVTPEQISFFFHEWLHYFHNVSTIHGLSAYANLVGLWSDFRHTTNENGISGGSARLTIERSLQVRQKQGYLRLARTESTTCVPKNITYHYFSIKCISEEESKIEGLDISMTNINCTVVIDEPSKRSVEIDVIIGTHEIIEGVAWMLESKLSLALGSIAPDPAVSPYQIVRKLAQHFVPGISDDLVIACMLCALQDSNPTSLLLDALKIVKAAIKQNEDALEVLRHYTIKTLCGHETWIEKHLQGIENTFVVDEAMALAVRSTADTLRKNFTERMRDPFLEFDLINILKVAPAFIDHIIRSFGACTLIQQCPGPIQQLQRDIIYEFAALGPTNIELQFGWRMMHASFRYVALHTSVDGFSATTDLEQRKASKICPFFTACDLKLRIESPEICGSTPWRSASMPELEDRCCWYRAGVLATAPAPR